MIFNFNAAEVFDMAIKIEENGKKFYDEAVKLVDDPEVKKLFSDLAIEEVLHKARFESLKAQLPGEAATPTVFDPEHEMNAYIKALADQHVFRTAEDLTVRMAAVKDARSALRMAIEFEKDSVIFFLTMQDATDDHKGQAFISALVKEEQEHLRRLSLQLRRLR